MNKAVFLERDKILLACGTPELPFIKNLKDVTLDKEVIAALRLLKQEGFALFIIGNQPGVANGRVKPDKFRKITNRLSLTLGAHGIGIRQMMFCTHAREEGCLCRLPQPRLLNHLMDYYDVDPEQSFIVGPHPHHMEAGWNAGLKTVHVGNKPDRFADITAETLMAAVQQIVNHQAPRKSRPSIPQKILDSWFAVKGNTDGAAEWYDALPHGTKRDHNKLRKTLDRHLFPHLYEDTMGEAARDSLNYHVGPYF